MQKGFNYIETSRSCRNDSQIGRCIKRFINEGFYTREDFYIALKIYPFKLTLKSPD